MAPPPVPLWRGVSIAIGYGAVAVAANFVNKYAVSVLPLPMAILFVQLLATLLMVQGARSSGLVATPPISKQRAWVHLPVSLAYVAHALLVLLSLTTLSVPMYNTLKRATPVMVLATKAFMEKRMPEPQITGSVVVIVAGCVVAGIGDLDFNLYGYVLALTCAAMQALYMLLAERLAAAPPPQGTAAHHHPHSPHHHHPESGLAKGSSPHAHGPAHKPLGSDAAEQLLYMSLAGIPVLALLLIGSGQLPQLAGALQGAHAALGPSAFAPWFITTAVIECTLTGALLLCTHVNSALTTSIVGVLKSVFAVVLGFFLLGGVRFAWMNVVGIGMNLGGGVWYSVAKYRSGGKPSA